MRAQKCISQYAKLHMHVFNNQERVLKLIDQVLSKWFRSVFSMISLILLPTYMWHINLNVFLPNVPKKRLSLKWYLRLGVWEVPWYLLFFQRDLKDYYISFKWRKDEQISGTPCYGDLFTVLLYNHCSAGVSSGASGTMAPPLFGGFTIYLLKMLL